MSALGAFVLLLSACSTSPLAQPTLTASPSPTASPTPSESAAPVHTIAFGDDCANLLTEEEAADLLGAGTQLSEYSDGSSPGLGTLGGIECVWQLPEGGAPVANEPEFLVLLATPADTVPADIIDETTSARCDPSYDAMVCRLGRTVDGVWLMASTSWLPTEPDEVLLGGALSSASARLGEYPSPVRLLAGSDWWALSSCDELGTRTGLTEMLGEGYLTGWWEGNPTDTPEYRLTEHEGVEQSCSWLPDYTSEAGTSAQYGIVVAEIWPGGGWDAARLLRGGAAVQVDGADQASSTPESGIVAVVGANALRVRVHGKGDAAILAAHLIAALED